MGPPADVAVMGPVDREEKQGPVAEHRVDRRDVRQVAAAEVGVVQDEKVALVDVVAEVRAHRFDRGRQGADMHGDPLALRHELSRRVQDRGREVPAGVQDLRHGGADHDVRHLAGDRFQAVAHDRMGNRVRRVRCCARGSRCRARCSRCRILCCRCRVPRVGYRCRARCARSRRVRARGSRCRFRRRGRYGQHHAPVGIHFKPVSGFHEHGGEIGLHDGRTFNRGTGREVVGRENGGFGPGAREDAARALAGVRGRLGCLFAGQYDRGQFPRYRGPQGDQADFLVELMVGVQDLVSLMKPRRP